MNVSLAHHTFRPWSTRDARRILADAAHWQSPDLWNAAAERAGERRRVEVGVDVFEDFRELPVNEQGDTMLLCDGCGKWHADDDAVQSESCSCSRFKPYMDSLTLADVRAEIFRIIDRTPHLTWLLRTAAPENIQRLWPSAHGPTTDKPGVDAYLYRPNLALFALVHDQPTADARLPALLKLRGLAGTLGAWYEPRGMVNWRLAWRGSQYSSLHFQCNKLGRRDLDLIVCRGGETPIHPDWLRSTQRQCEAAGTPFWFDGWNQWVSLDQSPECAMLRDSGCNPGFCRIDANGKSDPEAKMVVYMFGPAHSGRLLDGVEHVELPEGWR